ncbi:hypothetical protein Tco_1559623 [Tanacetum coccineum]
MHMKEKTRCGGSTHIFLTLTRNGQENESIFEDEDPFLGRKAVTIRQFQATAEILCQAEADIRNQGVSAVQDPAGVDSAVKDSAGVDSAVRVPSGIVSADGVFTGSPSADSDPAGGNPADSFPPAVYTSSWSTIGHK